MKFELSKKRGKHVIGVDIGSSAIKMVELSGDSLGRCRLENYVIVPLNGASVSAGGVESLNQVGEVITKALKQLGTRERNAALAMPFSDVIVKRTTMIAGLSEVDMEDQVSIEAEQFMPFKIEEVNVDFYIDENGSAGEGEVAVVVAVSKKDKIEDRVAVAEAAGLKVLIVDLEQMAIESSLSIIPEIQESLKNDTVMIIDAGSSYMNIHTLHKGVPVYARQQNFSGTQLVNDIHSRYEMSNQEAELKNISGDLPEGFATDIEEPFAKSTSMEVARAVQFFTSSTQYSVVDLIVLVGGCSTIESLPFEVETVTGVKTIAGNPFEKMELSTKAKKLNINKDSASLMVACGLALRGFD